MYLKSVRCFLNPSDSIRYNVFYFKYTFAPMALMLLGRSLTSCSIEEAVFLSVSVSSSKMPFLIDSGG